MEPLGYIVVAIYILFFFILIIGSFVELFIEIAGYILVALANMKIAKKLGVKDGFLAFIPYAKTYLFGKLAEKDGEINHPEKKPIKWSVILLVARIAFELLLILGVIVIYAAVLIPLIGQSPESTEFVLPVWSRIAVFAIAAGMCVLALSFSVLAYIVYYKVYHVMAGKNAWWMLLLTILFSPVAEIVILLVLAFSKKFPTARMPDSTPDEQPIPETVPEE